MPQQRRKQSTKQPAQQSRTPRHVTSATSARTSTRTSARTSAQLPQRLRFDAKGHPLDDLQDKVLLHALYPKITWRFVRWMHCGTSDGIVLESARYGQRFAWANQIFIENTPPQHVAKRRAARAALQRLAEISRD